MKLVTVATCKNMLRVDDSDAVDDAGWELIVEAASERVALYLGTKKLYDVSTSPPTVVMDLTTSPPTVPRVVQLATVVVAGVLYRAPDSNPDDIWGVGELPRPAASLMHQLRVPTVR